MAYGKTNKEPKINKRTRSAGDRQFTFDEQQAKYRKEAGVEIGPASRKDNKKF
jgi:hypothetical protein